eukprot:3114662-Rhodomonas_salina.1
MRITKRCWRSSERGSARWWPRLRGAALDAILFAGADATLSAMADATLSAMLEAKLSAMLCSVLNYLLCCYQRATRCP